MGNNIKDEFKDFINTLSIEICKEVLLEELKEINESFEQTEETYEELAIKYKKNIDSIKNQVIQLQSLNKKISEFVISISSNNTKIDRALNIINGEHKVVIDKIVKDNTLLLQQFSTKVSSLNKVEREAFIKELTTSMDLHSKKYIDELRNIAKGNEINNIEKKVILLTEQVNQNANLIKGNFKNFEASIDNIEKAVCKNEKILSLRIKETNNKIDSTLNSFNIKISNLSAEIQQKNNLIIILISVIIILSIISMNK